jgi:1,4-alpha-glucan branching enzyme
MPLVAGTSRGRATPPDPRSRRHAQPPLKTQRALHELDAEPTGFHWLSPDDAANSCLVYERVAKDVNDRIICALNFRRRRA